MESKIKVFCRIRPHNHREKGICSVTVGGQVVHVVSKPPQTFSFDHAAGPETSQERVFSFFQPLVDSCLSGFNGTILAYGMTGSGKTHTLFGGLQNESRGLIPRALEYLWQRIRASEDGDGGESITTVSCSFFEIYNEKVYDLLSESGNSLQVREDAKRGVFVDGALHQIATSPSEALSFLQQGLTNRHTGSTNMNRESSRSHAVFSLVIDSSVRGADNGVLELRRANLTLVDLAGSERQKDTGAEGTRLIEAKNINRSLLTLGNVIQGLSESTNGTVKGSRHISYRDSTLTYLLRDSIGGNSRTILVAAISPAQDSILETISTLKFAQRASSVKNVVRQNIESCSSDVVALQKVIESLRARLMLAEGDMALASPAHRHSGIRLISFGSGTLNSVASVASGSLPVEALDEQKQQQQQQQQQLSHQVMPFVQFEGNLLSESLERAKFVDEERMRAELNCIDLQKRLDQSEKLVLQQKMQIKMRESEILRFKKGKDVGVEALTDEEVRSVEINAVKLEMQADILKYKQRCEELERRLRRSSAGSKFDENRELQFQHDLLGKIEQSEKTQENLARKFEEICNEKFEEAAGISLVDALELKGKCQEMELRLEETEAKSVDIRAVLIKTQQLFEAKQQECVGLMLEAERESVKVSERTSEFELTIAALNREIQAMQAEQQLHQKSEVEVRDQCTKSLALSREAYNNAMKDNCKPLTALKAEGKRAEDSENLLAEIKITETSLRIKCEELEGLNKESDRLRDSLSQSDSKLDEQTKICQNLKDLAAKLEEANLELGAQFRSLESDHVQLQKDHELLSLQRDRLEEQYESAAAQVQSLVIEKTDAENSLMASIASEEAARAQAAVLKQRISNHTAELEQRVAEHTEAIQAATGATRLRISELEQQVVDQAAELEKRTQSFREAEELARSEATKLKQRIAIQAQAEEVARIKIFELELRVAEAKTDSAVAQDKLFDIRRAISDHEGVRAGGSHDDDICSALAAQVSEYQVAQQRIKLLEEQLSKAQEIVEDVEGLKNQEQKNARKLSKAIIERQAADERVAQLEAERDAATSAKEQSELEKNKLLAELAGHVNTKQKIQLTQQMKAEIDILQAHVREKNATIQQQLVRIDGLHKQLRNKQSAEKERAVEDCIQDVIQRKARARGLAAGKENSLLALPSSKPPSVPEL